MEHRPRRRDERSGEAAHIDPLADERVAGLGEVDADLVLAARLQLAGDEGRATERLQHGDVGDGTAGGLGRLALRSPEDAPRAAQAVAAVGDEERVVGRALRPAVDDREIAPLHRVRPELLLEVALGGDRAGEDEEARGLLVEPLHDPQVRPRPAPRAPPPGEGRAGEGDQGVAVLLAPGDGQETGRLPDDDDLRIGMDDVLGPERPARRPRPLRPELDDAPLSEPRRRVERRRAVHPNPAAPAERAGPAPRGAGEERADEGGDRRLRLLRPHGAGDGRRDLDGRAGGGHAP